MPNEIAGLKTIVFLRKYFTIMYYVERSIFYTFYSMIQVKQIIKENSAFPMGNSQDLT